MSKIQHFTSDHHGVVAFIDKREQIHSARCQPRDIEVVDPCPTTLTEREWNDLREEIAVEIRRNMGEPEIGVRKNLKF